MDDAVASALLKSSRRLRASARDLWGDLADTRKRAEEAVARARRIRDTIADRRREPPQESLDD